MYSHPPPYTITLYSYHTYIPIPYTHPPLTVHPPLTTIFAAVDPLHWMVAFVSVCIGPQLAALEAKVKVETPEALHAYPSKVHLLAYVARYACIQRRLRAVHNDTYCIMIRIVRYSGAIDRAANTGEMCLCNIIIFQIQSYKYNSVPHQLTLTNFYITLHRSTI